MPKSTTLVICRHIIILGTLIGGFILWLTLPQHTAIHFNLLYQADGWGNKLLLLPTLFLPFLADIPFELPKFHTDSEETRLALENAKRKNAIIQLLVAIVLAIIAWLPLLISV